MTTLLALLVAAAFFLAGRARLLGAGKQALREQPDAIVFSRVPGDQWRDPVTAERLAKPLREKGFVDLGVYAVLPLGGFRLGVMVNEKDRVAAFLCERPKALGISLELNVRYADGTTTMLINRADNAVPKPPFFRVIFDESGASSGALYERLLRERSSAAIKAITAENVFTEYQSAWTKMMRWEKGRGLSVLEVSAISQRGLPAAGPGGASDAWSTGFPGGAEKQRDAVSVERDGTGLRISWGWGPPAMGYFLLVVAVLWYNLTAFLNRLGAGSRQPGVDFGYLLFGPALSACYAYMALVLLLNRTVIRVDSTRLTVRRGPVPYPGSRDVPIEDIVRLYGEEYVNYGARYVKLSYRVKLVRKDGKELDLVSGLATSGKADFIVEQLKGCLGI